MKTVQQLIKMDLKSQAIDGRDFHRLAEFLSEKQLKKFGMELKDDFKGKHKPKKLTRSAILKRLKGDVSFGFEKALNQRGISSGLQFEVVRMWNLILEDGLEDWNESNYAQYGLPLFKATAKKYGFDNPIGDDSGSEFKYSSHA